MGTFSEAMAMNRLMFSTAIKQYVISTGVKLSKMANLYFGTTSPSKLLDNYAVYMALNPNHDALKYIFFRITSGQHAQTWYANLPQGSI